MTYYEKAKDIMDKVLSGRILQAFEEYYHEDVVMIEGSGDVRKGKDVSRKSIKRFMARLEAWNDGKVIAITSDEEKGITMIESWIDVTFHGGMHIKMEQVARQKWLGDKIIEERFYYNPHPHK